MKKMRLIAIFIVSIIFSGTTYTICNSSVSFTFSDLGFTDITMKGIGIETYSANLTANIEGKVLVNIILFFYKEYDNAYIEITFYFNNEKISAQLDKSPKNISFMTENIFNNTLKLVLYKLGLGTITIFSNSTISLSPLHTEQTENIENYNLFFKVAAPFTLLLPFIIRYKQIKKRNEEMEIIE